ncbi:MAG: S8 family serine peptidase [Arenicellales bacterium]|nr:S8 family serine peptidase [Arenicellales bacterium]
MSRKIQKSIASAALALTISPVGAAPDVNSAEYLNQGHLAGIKVVPAWDAGLLGNGIVIANLDSGVLPTHVDLVGTIAPGGYDFVNDDDDPLDDDVRSTAGHGTASSGIIVGNWNGVGIGGIAPSARILPVKISDEGNKTTAELISQGVEYAAAQANVRIIQVEAVRVSLNDEELAPFEAAAAAGKLIIMPSGNGAGPAPYDPGGQLAALGSAALVVGSHDGDGNRSTFSNGAAGVESNFITALGEGVLTASNRSDTALTRNTGTSMAAPQVAAAAALIWSHAPGLSAGEVAEILKTTATDIGSAGIDSETGYGALNIEAALAPIGIITAPIEEEDTEDDAADAEDDEDSESAEDESDTDSENSGGSTSGDGGSGGGAGVALAALVVGGVGYALISNDPDLSETLVLDEYGRTYELDLETRISVRNPGPSARSVLQELETEQVDETLIQRSDMTMTVTYATDRASPSWQPREHGLMDPDRPVRMRMSAALNDGVHYAFGINQSLSFLTNALVHNRGPAGLAGGFQTDAFSTPFYGFTDLGYHGAIAFRSDSGWRSGLSFATVDDQRRYGIKSDSANLHIGLTEKRFGVGVQLGLLEEDGNLLGGASTGALSVSQAETVFAAFGGHIALDRRWSLVGKYTHGLTWADNYSMSLVQDFSEIESNSWGIGLVARDLFDSKDAFGIALSQPLRTIDGSARVSVPYWNHQFGDIAFRSKRTSLVPDGTETSLELFYRKPLGKHTRLIHYLVYRDQALHRKGGGGQISLVAAIDWKFGGR